MNKLGFYPIDAEQQYAGSQVDESFASKLSSNRDNVIRAGSRQKSVEINNYGDIGILSASSRVQVGGQPGTPNRERTIMQ